MEDRGSAPKPTAPPIQASMSEDTQDTLKIGPHEHPVQVQASPY